MCPSQPAGRSPQVSPGREPHPLGTGRYLRCPHRPVPFLPAAREGTTMADALHRADVEEKLSAVEHGDAVSFNYRSHRSDAIRAKSGRVVDAYSPMGVASTVVVRDGESMYEIKPDGTVRSQDVGDLGTLTRLTIT